MFVITLIILFLGYYVYTKFYDSPSRTQVLNRLNNSTKLKLSENRSQYVYLSKLDPTTVSFAQRLSSQINIVLESNSNIDEYIQNSYLREYCIDSVCIGPNQTIANELLLLLHKEKEIVIAVNEAYSIYSSILSYNFLSDLSGLSTVEDKEQILERLSLTEQGVGEVVLNAQGSNIKRVYSVDKTYNDENINSNLRALQQSVSDLRLGVSNNSITQAQYDTKINELNDQQLILKADIYDLILSDIKSKDGVLFLKSYTDALNSL